MLSKPGVGSSMRSGSCVYIEALLGPPCAMTAAARAGAWGACEACGCC
jgi:hypothetical protein